MIAPGLDRNLDHELNRGPECCDLVTQSDSVGLASCSSSEFRHRTRGSTGAKAVAGRSASTAPRTSVPFGLRQHVAGAGLIDGLLEFGQTLDALTRSLLAADHIDAFGASWRSRL